MQSEARLCGLHNCGLENALVVKNLLYKQQVDLEIFIVKIILRFPKITKINKKIYIIITVSTHIFIHTVLQHS